MGRPDGHGESLLGCVKNALVERDAVPEMKEDPSESACRSRLQTAVSCCRSMAVVVNVHGKGATHASCAGWRDERKQTTVEASKQIFRWHQDRSALALREERGGHLITGHAVSAVEVA